MTRLITLVPAISSAAMPMLRWAGIAVAAGALLAVLGPFGSYLNGDALQLAAYWIIAMLLGSVLYGAAYRIVRRLTPRSSRRWWPTLVGAMLLASAPEALLTRMGAFWLWPAMAQLRLPLLLWYAQTATIGLISMAGVSVVLRRSEPLPKDDASPPPEVQASGLSLGGDVLALQMEDHYVRVHRPTGSELILMPLGRAIECAEPKGLRIHRSWWVASNAVAAVEGNARSMRLILSNGLVAPVARSAVTHLKAAGWTADAKSGIDLWKQGVPVPKG